MSDTPKLGQILEGQQHRDAIHIAIAPVIAAEKLSPGQDIGFVGSGTIRVGASKTPLGIVDPFLKAMVYPEQQFFMFLYPQTITSLRHEWTHPAFEEIQPAPVVGESDLKAASQKWMEEFAATTDYRVPAILERAGEALRDGWPYVEQGSETLRDAFYAVVVKDKEQTPFSCSC